MSKEVKPIEEEYRLWITFIDGDAISVGENEKRQLLLKNKLNELIEAHNEHVKTCHLEVHIDGNVADKLLIEGKSPDPR